MKVFYPKNINGGWLNLNFPVGPFKVSLIQLLIIAAGAALSLAIWQGISQSGGGKAIAVIVAVPVMCVFLFIAFFEISEMNLGHFITKLLRTNILDETIKFQNNTQKIDNIEILTKRAKLAIQDAEHIVAESKSDERMSTEQLKKVDIITSLANK